MRRWLAAGVAGVAAMAVIAAGYKASVGRSPGAPPELEHMEPDLRSGVMIQLEPLPVDKQMAGQSGIVQMAVTDRGFEPRLLSAPIGGAVKIHLRNTGSQPHNFMLPHFGIVTGNLAPGSENYIDFPASQKGDWPFFSDAPGQEEPGLAGILKVE